MNYPATNPWPYIMAAYGIAAAGVVIYSVVVYFLRKRLREQLKVVENGQI